MTDLSAWHYAIAVSVVLVGLITLYAIRYYRESGKMLGLIKFL